MKPVITLSKYLRIPIILLCLSPYFLKAQGVQKEILRNFQLGPKGQISVIHKNGDIDFRTWDHPRVMVRAIITLKETNVEKAQQIFKSINLEATQRGNKLDLKTTTPYYDSSSPGGYKGNPASESSSLAGKSDQYRMDYIITIPNDASLLVSQQFGDLSLGEFAGPISLDLSHGKINIKELKGTADLSFNYINGSILKMNKVYLEAHRSNLHFVSTNHINIRSAYSEFQIDKVDSLISSHKHNEFEISTVAYLKMDEEYSDIKVTNLTQKGDLSVNYGDLELEKLSPNMSNLSLSGELSDFIIKTGNKSAYSLDIDSKETQFHLPQDLVIFNQQANQPQLKSITRLSGVRELKNVQQKTTPKITIATKEGQVTLE